jgi:peptidoglycan glycosyltransferase
MDKRRLIGLVFLFTALAGIALYFLLDRMILNRQDISLARYTDRKFIALMENLIHENVFKIEGKEIVIEEEALNRQGLNKKTVERVRRNIPQLYLKEGRISFDHLSASIANLRDKGNVTTLRGMFLDRNGVALVRSMLDEKTWTVKREYTQGPECYPLTGHNSIVYGRRNLEKHLDEYLDGSSHGPLYRPTSDPFRKLKLGDDVHLTIDSRVQRSAYEMMRGLKGAVVVLNVKTGEILAAVSTPTFDPNTRSADAWRRAFSDSVQKSYENRAFSALYPPGSTFKTVVASALLEEGILEKEKNPEQIACNGKKNRFGISDIYPHGKVGFDSAFVLSCNQFFSEIGVVLGQAVQTQAGRFGFNRQIDLLPQLKGPQYAAEMSLAFSWRDPQKLKSSGTEGNSRNTLGSYREIDFRRNPKIVAQGAIGQNLIAATPLQMAMVAAALANRGTVMNPFLIKQIKDGKGKVLFEGRPVKIGQAVQTQTADRIRQLMERVMQNGTGKNVKRLYLANGRYTTLPSVDVGIATAQSAGFDIRLVNVGMGETAIPSTVNSQNRADLREIHVAGKTGTAEVGDRNGNGVIDPDEKPHSWFIGFAPADAPRVAIAVVAENQGFGSLTAAPIAVEVFANALNGLQSGRK